MSSDSQGQPPEPDDWPQTDAEGDIWSGYIWPEHVVDWYQHLTTVCSPSALEDDAWAEAVGPTKCTSQPIQSGEDSLANRGVVGARRRMTSAITDPSTRDEAGSSEAGFSQDQQNLGLLTLYHDGESMVPRDDRPTSLSPISSENTSDFVHSDGLHSQETIPPERPRRRRSETTRRKIREAALGRIIPLRRALRYRKILEMESDIESHRKTGGRLQLMGNR